MTIDKYETLITQCARKCIELNPDDPMYESMEFTNDSIWQIFTNDEIKQATNSLADSLKDNKDTQGEHRDDRITLDAIDYDICKRIRTLTHIHSIYDNNGDSFDRYTVVINEMHDAQFNMCLGLSEHPASPQGYSQFGSCQLDGDNSHLGEPIAFEELPTHIQLHIQQRLTNGN